MTPEVTLSNRFHRDLNSDRWIQSPECLPLHHGTKLYKSVTLESPLLFRLDIGENEKIELFHRHFHRYLSLVSMISKYFKINVALVV